MSLTKGLVVHWTMDDRDVSPTVVADRSGLKHDGVRYGTTAPGNDSPVGESLFFDATTEAHLRGPDRTIPTQYTFATWIKGDLAEQNEDNNYVFGFNGRIALTPSGGSSNKYVRGGLLIRNAANDGYHSVWNGDNVLDGAWHHFGGTVDQDTLLATIYIDGEQAHQKTLPDHYDGTHAIVHGIWSAGGYGAMTCYTSDARYYERVLSAREMAALAAQQTPRLAYV